MAFLVDFLACDVSEVVFLYGSIFKGNKFKSKGVQARSWEKIELLAQSAQRFSGSVKTRVISFKSDGYSEQTSQMILYPPVN